MTVTNFPNGVSSFGVPLFGLNGLIPIPGNVYYLDNDRGLDSNNGLDPTRPKKTLSNVHSVMTANQNDVAVLIGHSSAGTGAFRESSNLLWTKNLTHILGTAYNRVAHRVSLRATSGNTTITKAMDNSAQGCLFANFHVFQGNSTAADQMAWEESGGRNAHLNLHIGGGGHVTPAARAGSRDIAIEGSNGENYFSGCVIGLDTVVRGAAMANLSFNAGTARNLFEDCVFQIHTTSSTAPIFITAGTNDIDRWAIFKRCQFTNSGAFTSPGATLAQAFSLSSNLNGPVIMENCLVVGVTAVETSNSAQLYILGASGVASLKGVTQTS
ncbi:hypothetical protein LCGC14_2393630 [marine sediment metagenome]|uniref:DUF1565 domain-containing protein n=1 Tax=marine sediment metagenome TaxID=412755 RepID=A0A0F9ERW5_9ZZZZ